MNLKCLQVMPPRHVAWSRTLTCILTTWPSPFWPLTIAVTTTSWSFATKLRMHRSFLLDEAAKSNLSADANWIARKNKATKVLIVNGEEAMVGGIGPLDAVNRSAVDATWKGTLLSNTVNSPVSYLHLGRKKPQTGYAHIRNGIFAHLLSKGLYCESCFGESSIIESGL